MVRLTADNGLTPPDGSNPNKRIQQDFDRELVRELGNLTLIAYKDYELFNDRENRKLPNKNGENVEDIIIDSTVDSKTKIWVKNDINNTTINEYSFYEDEKNGFSIDYEILKTFTFISYTFPLIPHLDRFGFIAKKDDNLYFVFRGTRELEEWFNNSQFLQVAFLSNKDNRFPEDHGENRWVSLGFNKIYTDYRPGLLIRFRLINSLFYHINDWAVQLAKKLSKLDNGHTPIFQVVQEFLNDEKNLSGISNIYITGHSLGGALATIAALHIAKQLNEIAKQLNESQPSNSIKSIELYSFASPRVGNPEFAQSFNEEKINAFRLVNSEDIVPSVPPATFKFIGEEMLEENKKRTLRTTLRYIWEKIASSLLLQKYEHVGKPLCFTNQQGAYSSNHNMSVTYMGAISENN